MRRVLFWVLHCNLFENMGIEQSLLVKLIAKCADDEVKVEFLSYSHYAVIIRKPSSPKNQVSFKIMVDCILLTSILLV